MKKISLEFEDAEVAESLKHQVLEALSELRTQSPEELVKSRIDKFSALGEWEEE